MPRMSDELAAVVVALGKDNKFVALWKYFRAIEEEIQEQINMPSTPKDEREILVHVKSRLREDVIRVLETAQTVLERKDAIKRG